MNFEDRMTKTWFQSTKITKKAKYIKIVSSQLKLSKSGITTATKKQVTLVSHFLLNP